MRSLVFFIVGFAGFMAGIHVSETGAEQLESWKSSLFNVTGPAIGNGRPDTFYDSSIDNESSVELVLDIEHYDDPDYGFSVAIPAGWRRVVSAEPEEKAVSSVPAGIEMGSTQSEGGFPDDNLPALEPGYAVGFESAHQHDDDQFADYILVEILPGESSGLFAADANHRQSILIDGRPAWYDRLEVKQSSTGLTDVDLVIYQAELAGVGYTVGLYAIGEHTSEKIMAIAFEVMLQTFRVERPPFSVS